jgi:PhoPQ-activated pathogenicity-related protein
LVTYTHQERNMTSSALWPCLLLTAAATLFLPAAVRADAAPDLEQYLQNDDASFDFTLQQTVDLPHGKGYTLRMTSQTWRGNKWEHWLSIIEPPNVKYPDQMILVIMGGSNRRSAPDADSTEARAFTAIAVQLGVPIAVLEQVPNQPILGGKYEDDAISFTFAKYLEGDDDDWPLLLPMVKSAVRAMDAAQAFSEDKLGRKIEKFIVTGASKRGWTTWLTGAVDDRVTAIAPMVIDVLNMKPQMDHQRKTYGGFSEKVGDYTKRDIQGQMDTPRGRQLRRIVDPFEYREQLDMPKLVLLGTNDPYWTADACSLYFDDLLGTKHIHYAANKGHGLGLSILPTTMAFIGHALEGKTLPKVTWKHNGEGELIVEWESDQARPVLWTAQSDNRDFRRSPWSRQVLDGDGRCVVKVPKPQKGWTAYYVELLHGNGEGLPFSTCTSIHVTPQSYPQHE